MYSRRWQEKESRSNRAPRIARKIVFASNGLNATTANATAQLMAPRR